MQRMITLPNRKQVTLGAYVAAWKTLLTCDPDEEVRGWTWYPIEARYVLRAMREGLQDRINQRGGLVIREANPSRIRRQCEQRLRHSCKWCGSPLGRYAPEHDRFCERSCARAYKGY